MKQLIFDNDFKNLIAKPLNWTNSVEIPANVQKYIQNISNSTVIYDENLRKYYCPLCLKELNKDNCCPKCLKKYNIRDNKVWWEIENIKDLKYENFYSYFDVLDGEVILYIVHEDISYNSPYISIPYRISKLKINNAFHILNKGIVDLINNKYYSYEEINNKVKKDEDSFEYSLVGDYIFNNNLYTDNLEELKNTIYRYTKIWEAKNYLKKNYVGILDLIYTPIYFKGFEYLMNLKFYTLAFNKAYLINYEDKVKQLFKDQDYVKFMIKNEFKYNDLEAALICKTYDKDLLKFMTYSIERLKKIINMTNINIKKLKDYFAKNKYKNYLLIEYYDYIRFASTLGLNLKDKNILFPKDLLAEHNKLQLEFQILKEPNMASKIEELANKLAINTYEDEKYIIKAAPTLESLIDESRQQDNCVRTYCKAYSNNELQIYLMRQRKDVNKSFVTIEVRNGKVVQARCKYNKLPNENIKNVLKKFEGALKIVE